MAEGGTRGGVGMSDDPNAPPAPPRRSPIVCELCECTLTPTGDVLTVSAKAKEYRRLEDAIDNLKREKESIAGELEAARRDLAALREPEKKSAGGIPWPV